MNILIAVISLYVYGGYDFSVGILSDFLYIDLNEENEYIWRKERIKKTEQGERKE